MKFLILIFIVLNLFGNDYTDMKEAFDKGDINRAIVYARNNATIGNVNAMYNLALLYYSKDSTTKAQQWFENSVKNGGEGKLGIALILFDKSKTKSDYKKILKRLENAQPNKITNALSDILNDLIDDKNDAPATSYVTIAELFSNDKLINPNNNLAFFLMEKAAQKGDPKALEMIADAYNTMQKSPITAPRVQNTLLKAIKYYEQAYKLGNYDAMAKLGRLHLIGPRHVRRIPTGKQLIKDSAMHGSTLGNEMLKEGYMDSPYTQEKNEKKEYHILFKEF